MQRFFLVNVIPLYLGEAGQVQDKLLGNKIYTSEWSVSLCCEGCLQNGFTPGERERLTLGTKNTDYFSHFLGLVSGE